MLKAKKELYYKCKKCGDEIYWNTHKKYTQCSCGALAVDGCEEYVRVGGDAKNYKQIKKARSKEELKALEDRFIDSYALALAAVARELYAKEQQEKENLDNK
jgi:hypothetical protein